MEDRCVSNYVKSLDVREEATQTMVSVLNLEENTCADFTRMSAFPLGEEDDVAETLSRAR